MTSPSPASDLPVFDFAQRLPPFGLQLPARMTALPFGNRELALVSPVPIDDSVAQALAELGQVTYLIAPNLLHHLYLGQALRRYPHAKLLAPRALSSKCPHLTVHAPLEQGLPADLAAEVQLVPIEGAPAIDEFAFFHAAARALVVTDLVFNVVRPRGLFTKLVLFLVGCYGKLAQSRIWRSMAKDRSALRSSAERLLALPFETLVIAHGELVRKDARAELARALDWLLPNALGSQPRVARSERR